MTTTTSSQNKRNGQRFGLHTNFALAGIQIEFGFCRGGRAAGGGVDEAVESQSRARKESGGCNEVAGAAFSATFYSCHASSAVENGQHIGPPPEGQFPGASSSTLTHAVWHSFAHPFIYPTNQPFIQSFIHLFVRSRI